MTFRRVILPPVLLLALCFIPSAQSQSYFDGDFWITKSYAVKVSYVIGFFDGRSYGIDEAAEAVGTTIQDPRISKLASEVTVGQTVDGVDDFYRDWRNRKVILRHAMQYVLDEAQGKDDSQLLLSMRKEDSARVK
jgi:hypothetical protein